MLEKRNEWRGEEKEEVLVEAPRSSTFFIFFEGVVGGSLTSPKKPHEDRLRVVPYRT
jgi:hypothetical protein